jgi:chemotaxis protein MotB
MAGQSNAAPVIIKRKKVIQGGGHHGGAWKVAYADFVTAMMAFFMLMWLLNATTEKQRKGIADYFNPTVPVNRISGGGDGAFGGDSILSEQTLTKTGTGASVQHPTDSNKASGAGSGGEANTTTASEAAANQAIEKQLTAMSGESMTLERVMRHVITRITDEGLVIEVFDLDDSTLFTADTATPTETMKSLSAIISSVLSTAENKVSVNGYLMTYPAPLLDNPAWELSTERAQAVRILLESAGTDATRIDRVTGHGDRKPATADGSAARNNRLEIVLLRRKT